MLTRLWHRIVSAIVCIVIFAITLKKSSADSKVMEKLNYSSSSKKMGLRFTERVRDAWRHRWIRIKR